MQFDSIIGTINEKAFLTGIIAEEKVPHALLLYGREGSAKYALALAMAQMIVCKNPTAKDSCGNCNACIKAAKLIHPDIHFVFPVIKKDDKKREETTAADFMKEWREISLNHPYFSFQDWTSYINAENSPPNINTRECQEIVKKLGLQTFESDSKVLIIWMPEYLGKEGNRLLKIIEEPTDNTYIIIVAEDLNRILGTILSRTQTVYVSPFSDDDIIEVIKDSENTVSDDDARQKASIADGNLGKALSAKSTQTVNYSRLLFEWIRVSYKSRPEDLVNMVDNLANMGRAQQRDFLQYGLNYLREYLYYLYTDLRGKRLTDDEFEIAKKMRQIMDLYKTEKLVELLDYSIVHINRNVNARVSFMSDSMSIGSILRSEEIAILKD
jgi:DNA polymerase-3 subunit delta'